MNFFSLFRKTDKTGTESTVNSDELVNDHTEKGTGEDEVTTALSFHPDWNVPKEQEYVFRFHSSELGPLKPSQLSLSGIDIDVEESTGSWLVKAFFRSTVQESITIGEIEIILSGKDEKVYARKEFDFNELGVIPSNSARPWVFIFEKDTQLEEEPPSNDWTLNFNLQSLIPHSLDLDASWEGVVSDEQVKSLEKVVADLPELNKNEVNLTGLQTHLNEDGSLNVVILIRNGSNQTMNLETLPLEILDASNEVVCKGSFNLPPLSVKANTTKPWTFIFPKETVLTDDLDFSRWVARVPQ